MLGWDTALDGWLSLAWQEHQEAYWAQWAAMPEVKQMVDRGTHQEIMEHVMGYVGSPQ